MTAELTINVDSFPCPRCEETIAPQAEGETYCQGCQWSGDAYLFQPLRLQVQEAESALPDDAVCAHHPEKKAVAMCAGTGSYICSLCSVELDDETYSAQFLGTTGGKGKVKGAFERMLDRPDRSITIAIAAGFLLYFLMPIMLPVAIYYFVRMRRFRKENEIYAELISRWKVILYGVILSLWTLAVVGGIVALVLSVTGVI